MGWVIKTTQGALWGPWSKEQIKTNIKLGILDPADLASKEGGDHFVPLLMIDEIFTHTPFPAIPPPPVLPDNTILLQVQAIPQPPVHPPFLPGLPPSPLSSPPPAVPRERASMPTPVHVQRSPSLPPTSLPHEGIPGQPIVLAWSFFSFTLLCAACAAGYHFLTRQYFYQVNVSSTSASTLLQDTRWQNTSNAPAPPPLSPSVLSTHHASTHAPAPKTAILPSSPKKTPAKALRADPIPKPPTFTHISQARSHHGKTIKLQNLRFDLAALQLCRTKCTLPLYDQAGAKIDLVFFKSVYASKLEINPLNAQVIGRFNAKTSTLVVSAVESPP